MALDQWLLADIEYSAWANQKLLETSVTVPAVELERDLQSSHGGILTTLCHICDGERVWLDCIRDTPEFGIYLLPPPPAPALSLEELSTIWPKLWEGYREWIRDQSDTGLNSEVIVQLPDQSPRFTRGKVLRHVLDHSQFHRGQVVAMIRALGHTPPAINRMDYLLGV